MADKEINVIIQNRHDTEAHWQNSNYIPKEGELVIIDNKKIKIGNDEKKVSELPFANEQYSLTLDDRTVALVGDAGTSSSITIPDSDTLYYAGTGLELET